MASLANIYRPNEFNEVVGNNQTIKALEALFDRKRDDIPHVFLFTGPKGCGKTTLGRIIKDMLGCSDMDFNEVDSADFRGIDTIREIRRQMQYSPADGDCRVWLMDEVHQLSKDAQSALLKSLEDTPEHVYFILCTTDPDKLLPTLLSRCKGAHFEVVPLDDDEMTGLLNDIVKAEKKKVPKDVIKQIVRDSMGSSRDAIMVLDKIIDLDPDDMLEVAERVAAHENQVIELSRALINRMAWKQVAVILKGLEGKEDAERTRLAVMGYCKGLLLSGKDAPQAALMMDEFSKPLWNNGFSGLVHYAYYALESINAKK